MSRALGDQHAADDTLVAVVDIVRAVLGIDDARADENFIALGGTSLAAAEVSSQIAVKLGISVAISTVLTAPTLLALSQQLRSGDRASSTMGGGF